VDGIKAITNSFTSVSFTHVKHNLNEAMHILAKSRFSVSSREFFPFVPDCIQGTLPIDVIIKKKSSATHALQSNLQFT
jgi:hypothetical protein